MTTKPKAKKFRIRRTPSQLEHMAISAAPDEAARGRDPQADGVERNAPQPTPKPAEPAPASPAAQQRPPQTTPQPGPPPMPKPKRRPMPADQAVSGSAAPQQPERQMNPLEASVANGIEDGFPAEGFRTAGRDAPTPAVEEQGAATVQNAQTPDAENSADTAGSPTPAEQTISDIRKEGLTGRQLRMARRLAQKNGLPATSDFDAVRLLRQAGIDPFKRENMLQLVPSSDPAKTKKTGGAVAKSDVNLPKIQEPNKQLPSTQVLDAAERARAVQDIQRDIARRRRRKLVTLFTRLAFFVFLPTLIAAYYFYAVATPMYATKSEFVIQKADAAAAPGLSSLFAGSGLATSQDSITVQSYLTSRDAMMRLDADLGFKAHFSDPAIDPIQRLPEDASNEAAYKLYKRNVKIGYDPSEGIMKMEVIAASPDLSAAFSEALIHYAEERVDNLTTRLRDDQMAGALASYQDAENKRAEAQAEVLTLQSQMGVFDATSDAAAVMSQINGFETELQKKNLQLQQLLDNPRPNQARVEGVRGDISRLQTVIDDLRAKLTEDSGGANGESLAQISGQLTVAQSNLETRTIMMQQALQQVEAARIEANKQTRYLSLGVNPVAPDEPTYPRAFEQTLLSFLVLAGIYLMMSLTASILREQVAG